jgi:putative hydrolase of the HAD superfamily
MVLRRRRADRPHDPRTIVAVAIQAVLFDFGGVILSSPFEAFSHYEATRDLPPGFLRSVNATQPDTNAWARLERGELDAAAFSDAFAEESAALGHRVPGSEVLALLAGELRPAVVEALRRCAARLRTALLTNNFVGTTSALADDPAIAEVLGLFDVIVESSRIGHRKPDPRFYELALEAVGIEAHEAVFLDDLGVNLKPARALGMTTIKVTDPARALRELEAIVGFPLG